MWTCVSPAISRNGVALLAEEIEGSYGTHDNEKACISKYDGIGWTLRRHTPLPRQSDDESSFRSGPVQLASRMGRSHTSSHLPSLPQVLSAGP
jgi:hypothetical protein